MRVSKQVGKKAGGRQGAHLMDQTHALTAVALATLALPAAERRQALSRVVVRSAALHGWI
jgi:hypothetical protein